MSETTESLGLVPNHGVRVTRILRAEIPSRSCFPEFKIVPTLPLEGLVAPSREKRDVAFSLAQAERSRSAQEARLVRRGVSTIPLRIPLQFEIG